MSHPSDLLIESNSQQAINKITSLYQQHADAQQSGGAQASNVDPLDALLACWDALKEDDGAEQAEV